MKKLFASILLLSFTLVLMFGGQSNISAAEAGPTGKKIVPTIVGVVSQYGVEKQNGRGLFDNTRVDEYKTNNVFYWHSYGNYIELQIDSDFRIWRSGTTSWKSDYKKLKTEKWDGTKYVDITSTQPALAGVTEAQWELTTTDLPSGKYKFSYNSPYRIDSEWYVEEIGELKTTVAAPTLTGQPGNSQNTLTWKAVTGATSYNIKRSTTASGPYTTIGANLTGLSYTDKTAVNGTTYYYVVTAVNPTDESANSNQVSAKPLAPVPVAPTAPTALSAKAENDQVTLSWKAATDAIGYNLKRSTTASGPYTSVASNVTGITYADKAVSNDTTYYYVVTAINKGQESGNSNEASATPTALPVVTPPVVTPPVVTPPTSTGNRALLVITLVSGLEKEYDLPTTDVNSFTSWYATRAAGTGPEVYTINKSFNKASFLSRKDNIAFDKIELYEVNEYTSAP